MDFRVKTVRTIDQLNLVAQVRGQSYGKHIPTLKETLRTPEEIDFKNSNVTLACEELSTSQVVGSLRITLNRFERLPMESIFELRSTTHAKVNAEVTRLVIPTRKNSRYIKLLLMKSLYLYCHALQVKWILICARQPLDREYERLGFVDIAEGERFVEVPYIGNVPHRALGLHVTSAERIWHEKKHPLYRFMIEENHSEIQIFDSIKSSWENPRSGSNPKSGQPEVRLVADSIATPPPTARH